MNQDNTASESQSAFAKLLTIMTELRSKCPWDSKQTLQSLKSLTIEETYELCEAIDDLDAENIKKELGDLLLHIVFYSEIMAEQHAFTIKDVIESLIAKLIRRHPHIYGEASANSPKEVEKRWEEVKMTEGRLSVLEGVPAALPSLIKAFRVQQKVSGVGFDFASSAEALDKVKEEFNELKQEIDKSNKERTQSEFGDLLFAIINYGRLLSINPDEALEQTNRKFIKRFRYIEDAARDNGLTIRDLTIDQMNIYWEQSKKEEV
ncbi:MAG: nucleoside triphosphate pyrophosphohydrolase [Bacteroidales bacterium]|jgi:XTP/dITP diphosphohydrolase|nr:nucleoside triphosphate pyrophosphohydrolase [Bacteroidales bacterium]